MRPNWIEVYRNVAHTYDRDDELVIVTRETLRLAASAIREANYRDYYHNFGAAEHEILEVLGEKNAEHQSEQRRIVEGPGGE